MHNSAFLFNICAEAQQAPRITDAKQNILISINNMPAQDYLETIGLSVSALSYMPIVVYPEDGSKVFRAGLKALDNGAVLITGSVPWNAEVSFSSIRAHDVIESTGKLLKNIMSRKRMENRSLLIYASCSRFWILGPHWKEEPVQAASYIKDPVPWHFVYSGGEIFPSILANGKVTNQLRNYSVIACVL